MMMEKKGLVVGEVVPCMLMALMEFCTIGLTILASTVFSKGLSPFVFVVYTNALSSIFLLPYNTFIVSRNKREDLIPWFFLLGFVGVTMAQNLAFVGLSYSSPIVAIGMGCLIPSISFVLAVICRKTNVDLKSSASRIKLMGTLVSLIGAVTLILYRGPVVQDPASTHLHQAPQLFVFLSHKENWVLGCALFAAANLCYSIWNIFQARTIEKCPEVMTVASSSSLFGTFQSALFALVIERDPSAWRLQLDMGLLVIVLTALFGSLIKSNVYMWCGRTKSQFYVTMFKPLGVPIAGMFGCLFFAQTFHYGSLMAAAITGIGYFIMMWGQLKEDESKRAKVDLPEERAPLLQEEQV
ncbi:putative EamA domain-containing protein [Helianthus annuus]|uniref:WAT1-related protein n=2 Tax=Helianthus annuus TaxID=4232 RepID=A0A9K3NBB5_HELAN|nr:WAT1-related protein At1g70260-like [Helianthus annuus]KAF5793535.1 putative EamA domain-containing protein [Helianthus annuus]KAJ0551876.1 putative EamA domain-containing protein [Helianthus annuus]